MGFTKKQCCLSYSSPISPREWYPSGIHHHHQPKSAQAVVDEMVKGVIQAIWNFAPVKLKVPEHIS